MFKVFLFSVDNFWDAFKCLIYRDKPISDIFGKGVWYGKAVNGYIIVPVFSGYAADYFVSVDLGMVKKLCKRVLRAYFMWADSTGIVLYVFYPWS